jgi:hypothetical protein
MGRFAAVLAGASLPERTIDKVRAGWKRMGRFAAVLAGASLPERTIDKVLVAQDRYMRDRHRVSYVRNRARFDGVSRVNLFFTFTAQF